MRYGGDGHKLQFDANCVKFQNIHGILKADCFVCHLPAAEIHSIFILKLDDCATSTCRRREGERGERERKKTLKDTFMPTVRTLCYCMYLCIQHIS